jgi:hypothetical protein
MADTALRVALRVEAAACRTRSAAAAPTADDA